MEVSPLNFETMRVNAEKLSEWQQVWNSEISEGAAAKERIGFIVDVLRTFW